MFLTFTEAREQLRVSRETLRKLIKTGEIAAHKNGEGGRTSHYRIDPASVSAYIKRREDAVKVRAS
jgi:excisionase family DNA binding protein